MDFLDIYSSYATDATLENNGTWRDVGEAKLLIARAGNKKYSKLLSAAVESNQRALDLKDDKAEALSDEIMVNVMAQAVLLDWKNVGYKGEPLPYSVESAKTLLAVKDFRALVSRLANEFDAYKLAKAAEVGKP